VWLQKHVSHVSNFVSPLLFNLQKEDAEKDVQGRGHLNRAAADVARLRWQKGMRKGDIK
jgi:hypothetical protein